MEARERHLVPGWRETTSGRLVSEAEDAAIVHAAVAFAGALGLDISVEGI